MPASVIPLVKPPIETSGGKAQPLWGFGGQFFTGLFENSQQVPPELTAALTSLRPGHSRIAVESEAVDPQSPARTALMSTIGLADRAGANVNLTWWHGPYFRDQHHPTPEGFLGQEFMRGFADVIEAARKQFRCVTHVTIQNEPNSHDLGRAQNAAASMQTYMQLYTLLDQELRQRPDPRRPAKKLRAAVQLVGGDLVAGGPAGIPGSDQADWIKFMQQHMAGVLNGYSIHIYAGHGDFDKLSRRLAGLLDFQIQKPVYVTEHGVRGSDFGDDNRPFEQGSLHGQNIEDTIEAAFQHAWFNALAPQYGVAGISKWATYRIDTGTTTPAGLRRPERDSGMLHGAGKGFAPTPTYAVTRLLNNLVGPNWKVTAIGRLPDTLVPDILVSVFAGPVGAQSLIALNRGSHSQQISVKLTAGTRYFGTAWNGVGDGKTTALPPVTAAADGLVGLTVPPSGLAALSTRTIDA